MSLNKSNLIEISGNLEDAEYLIDYYNKDENIDIKDDHGFTPLLAAVKNKKIENVKILLLRGADINCKCHEGNSSLDYAIYNLDIKMIELLLENNIKRTGYNNYLYMRYKFPFLKDFMIEDIKIYVNFYNNLYEKII
jgi:ankyrin repeat protein